MFQVERRKQKIAERQAPNPALAGKQIGSKAEFEKLRAEVSKRFSVQSVTPELRDNFLYVSKSEHLYRETMNKSHNKAGTSEPYRFF